MHALSRAILKLAVSTSLCKKGKGGEVKNSDPEMKSMISELKHNLVDATCQTENEIPLKYGILS